MLKLNTMKMSKNNIYLYRSTTYIAVNIPVSCVGPGKYWHTHTWSNQIYANFIRPESRSEYQTPWLEGGGGNDLLGKGILELGIGEEEE